jgi:hypothetical protein
MFIYLDFENAQFFTSRQGEMGPAIATIGIPVWNWGLEPLFQNGSHSLGAGCANFQASVD